MNVQINDCTIRDGGYLFAKNSPEEFVKGVTKGLVDAGIDIIEIGFLQNVVGGESIVYENSQGAQKYTSLIPNSASHFTGFCDNSRYSLEKLDQHDGKSFDYLRISFAKHERDDALKFVAGAKAKGYKVFANPMDAPSYTSEERREMIEKVNEIQPYAFSIVDTFGTMYLHDLVEIFKETNQFLDKSIRIGLHSHNNLQLSNALAETMIDLAIECDRDIAIDGSLYGMGRGAGNASTEVIAAYLNKRLHANYNLGILFDTIEQYILPYTTDLKWGYDLPMFVCGEQGSHVDNIYYLQKNYGCSAKEILNIVSQMSTSMKKRYGSNYSKTDFSELIRLCEACMADGRNQS